MGARRRGWRAGTAALAAALLASTGVWAGASAASADVSFGSRVDTRGAQSPNQAIESMESSIGRSYDSVRLFKLWNDTWPDSHARWLAQQGKTVLLSVKSTRSTGGTVLWKDIVAAQPGSALHSDMERWARQVSAYEGQVYFTFNHEPEASASSRMGTAEEYKAAFAKFAEIVRAASPTTKAMWIMTDNAFLVGAADRRQAVKWYPGDDVVDAIASDSYNWFTCRGQNERWRSLETIVTPMRNFGAQHPTEELWLAEFASTEDPAQPDRKAQWFRDAAALFKKPGWEQFAGVVYFNYPGKENCNWWVDSSAASLAAYKAMAQDPFYGGPGAEPPPPTDGARVLMVVGDAAAPTADDRAVRDRLTAEGHTVTVVDDGSVTVTAASAADVTLVPSSVGTGLGSRLRTATSPVVVWKPFLYDDMRMTGTATSQYGTVSASTLAVTTPDHPLAGGLTGAVQAYSSARAVAWGTPGAGATVVATVGGRGGLFVYPAGSALAGGGTASGCRIGFPAGATSSSALTSAGWGLFLGAVEYAVDGCA